MFYSVYKRISACLVLLIRIMYDKSVLLEILLQDKCRTLNDDGKSYPPSALVYITISHKMREHDYKYHTKAYLCNRTRKNCNGYKYQLQHHFGITSHNTSVNDTSYSEDTVMHTSASSVTIDKKKFNIIISAKNGR